MESTLRIPETELTTAINDIVAAFFNEIGIKDHYDTEEIEAFLNAYIPYQELLLRGKVLYLLGEYLDFLNLDPERNDFAIMTVEDCLAMLLTQRYNPTE